MNTVGVLIGLLALAGTVVWFCERRANPDQFSSEPRRGIGNGLWWAALTMSTVGYGDKAPRTGLGRVLAVVWMFGAIVLIALLTAQVTSFLTVSSLSGVARGPADLIHVRVGAIEDSPAKVLLRDKFGVAATGFPSFDAGLRALDRGDLDAFVGVEPVLRYRNASRFAGRLRVIGIPFTRGLRVRLPERLAHSLEGEPSDPGPHCYRRLAGDPSPLSRRRPAATHHLRG
jgi:polar amino acid transport system substrate-binding protein